MVFCLLTYNIEDIEQERIHRVGNIISMTRSILCCFSIVGSLFVHAFHRGNVFRTYTWSKTATVVNNEDFNTIRPFKLYSLQNSLKLRMSSVTDDKTDATAPVSNDFSKFAIGQEHEGSLISAKNFGVFVGIENGVNVLLPRSLLSKTSYEKLKKMAETKSEEKIKLELVGVSAENKTLSGKYIPPGLKSRADISVLQGLDTSNKLFNATVVSLHDFGIFAELDDYGIDGLIPASRMPQKMTTEAMSSTFPVGTKVAVKIEEVNVVNKKLVLSMKNNRADVSAFTGVASDKWLQAIVQKVTDFGLFARPAGFDTAGLVHRSQVPRDLITALKKRVPPSKEVNQTDVEYLFSPGDVIKVRVQSVAVDSRRLDLSMLPLRTRVEEEDEYIVEGRDPEGEEYKSYEDSDEEDEKTQYDAESTLLWWKGSRYVKEQATTETKDEEAEVLNESAAIVEGTWRRMFEVDMREDAADFSSKILEAEMKELEEEIGELGGLDDEMIDATGFGYRPMQSFGSFIPASLVPSALREQLEFFKETETAESALIAKLRGGKAVEKEELDNMLKAAELEVAGQNRRVSAEVAAVNIEAVAATTEAVASVVEAVVETITSSEEEPAPSE